MHGNSKVLYLFLVNEIFTSVMKNKIGDQKVFESTIHSRNNSLNTLTRFTL